MKSFSITDKGLKRTYNEDYYYSSDFPIGSAPNLYLVADGMGGHNAGDVASKLATDCVVNYISRSDETDIEKLLLEAIMYANTCVYKDGQNNPIHHGMGTTLVVCIIKEGVLYLANVGDSRLYIFAEKLKQITVDHSVVEELYRAGHISKEDRYNHPDKNMITRAIGAEMNVIIDYFKLSLEDQGLIMLCSDGLNKMLEDQELSMILESGGTVDRLCQELIRKSLEKGGRDNITITMIEYGKEVLS
jgi:protein phosphatase